MSRTLANCSWGCMRRPEYSTWAGMIVTQFGRLPGGAPPSCSGAASSIPGTPPRQASAALMQLRNYYGFEDVSPAVSAQTSPGELLSDLTVSRWRWLPLRPSSPSPPPLSFPRQDKGGRHAAVQPSQLFSAAVSAHVEPGDACLSSRVLNAMTAAECIRASQPRTRSKLSSRNTLLHAAKQLL